jgi:hypothetical protein
MEQSLPEVAQKQLSFFSFPNGRGRTLLNYDLIPRYLHDRAQKKVLLSEHANRPPRVIQMSESERYEIRPAILSCPVKGVTNDDGTPKEEQYAIYPGTRESLIEECLILFAQNGEFSIEKGEPGYRFDKNSNGIGVCFTLYQLRIELKRKGKEYRLDELREGIEVLALAKYRYLDDQDTNRIRGYIVSELDSIPNPDPNDKIRSDRIMYALFDPRASRRILGGHYRSYDAQCALSMKSPIARYLYKQFTHNWQQANKKRQTGSYRIVEQNESILASGCPLLSNPTKRKDNIITALNELSQAGIIEKLNEERDIVPVKSGRKVVDVHFMVHPTNMFIKQQIEGFKHLQESLAFGRDIDEKTKSRMIQVN